MKVKSGFSRPPKKLPKSDNFSLDESFKKYSGFISTKRINNPIIKNTNVMGVLSSLRDFHKLLPEVGQPQYWHDST